MAVFTFASLSWIFSARIWFKGPVRTIGQGEEAHEDSEKLDEKDQTSVHEREVVE